MPSLETQPGVLEPGDGPPQPVEYTTNATIMYDGRPVFLYHSDIVDDPYLVQVEPILEITADSHFNPEANDSILGGRELVQDTTIYRHITSRSNIGTDFKLKRYKEIKKK